MAAQKFLTYISNRWKLISAAVTSSGVANAGQLVALGTDGYLDRSLYSPAMQDQVKTLPASENIAAGAFVNVYSNAGTISIRNADASVDGKEAHGFVSAAVLSGASTNVYFSGMSNTGLTGLTANTRYYLSDTTPGGAVPESSAPTAVGHVLQVLGSPDGTTEMQFNYTPSILIGS